MKRKKISRPVFLLLAFLASTVLGAADLLSIRSLRIVMEEPPDAVTRWEGLALSLISLKEGDVYSEEKLVRSLEALRQSELFASIDVPDPVVQGTGLSLIFRLKPFARIRDIRIEGAFPLLEKEILNVMSLHVGDACRDTQVAKQAGFIRALFESEGYFRPEVALEDEKTLGAGHRVLRVRIRKGPYYHVKSLKITGNHSVSTLRLRTRMATWHAAVLPSDASRFIRRKLDADVELLKDFYRSRGFYDVSVLSEVDRDDARSEVRIRLQVNEGPRYRIHVEGNSAFFDWRLKRDLTLEKDGNRNDMGLRKWVRALQERYGKAGYGQARFSWTAQDSVKGGKRVRHIHLKVEEGPRSIVREVIFSGNRSIGEAKIREQLLTRQAAWAARGPFQQDVLQEDVRAIRALYLRRGFLDCRVQERVHWDDSGDGRVRRSVVHLDIIEGPQTLVGRVDVQGLEGIPLEEALNLLPVRGGEPFSQHLLPQAEIALAERISESGYPHVKVAHDVDISQDRSLADIRYRVEAGPKVHMGDMYFLGNFRTRPRTLAPGKVLESGQPFSLSKVLKAQRDIRNIQALSGARFHMLGLAEQAARVDMLAEVEEKKPYFFELATGYDTERRFYGQGAVGDNNLLGANKQLKLGLGWSQIGWKANLGLKEPNFLGWRIQSETGLFVETLEELNKGFGVRTYGASNAFSRPLSNRWNASLNFRLEYREQYRLDGVAILPEEAAQYAPRAILVSTPGLNYNNTDSFIRPTKGMSAALSVDLSNGLKNSLDNFIKYRADGRFYYSPLRRMTFAARCRLAHLAPMGQGRIPDDQLFFLGGTGDVRGFGENELRFDDKGSPVGGRISLLGSLEMRLDLGMNIEWTGFYDTGALRGMFGNPIHKGDAEGFRKSCGAGLRYITPIGPIGLLYGWKLDRFPGEGPGAWHFSIGYTL